MAVAFTGSQAQRASPQNSETTLSARSDGARGVVTKSAIAVTQEAAKQIAYTLPFCSV